MAVPVNDRRSGPYACSGGEVSLVYDFRLLRADDVAVWRRRGGATERLVLGIDYQVTGVGNAAGGSVLLSPAALADDRYVIEGARAHTRLTDIESGQTLARSLLNSEFDSLQVQHVELARDQGRALARSRFDAGGTIELPPAVAGYRLGFDDDLNLAAFPPGEGGGGGAIPDPLPVESGGTGGNTAVEARANIGALGSADVPAAVAADLAANASARRGSLGLGGLAVRDDVGTAQITDDTVTLAKMAHGTAGLYLGYDETGAPGMLQPLASTKVTGLARHAGCSGGAARAWIVDGTDVFVAGDSAILGLAVDVGVPRRVTFNVAPAAINKVVIGAGAIYILDAAGRVYHMGSNGQGQGGHGDAVARSVATRIEWFVGQGVAVADIFPSPMTGGAENYAFFLGQNGKAYVAGANGNGQHGMGDVTARSTPAEVVALGSTVAGVALSGNAGPHTLAWTSAGQLYGAGYNGQGQLGDGTTTARNAFVALSVTDAVKAVAFSDVSGGLSGVVRSGGGLQLTGHNVRGSLGQGDTTSRTAWTTAIAADVSDVVLAGRSVLARQGVNVQTFGANPSGQLGSGGTADVLSPSSPAGAFQGHVVKIAGAGVDTGCCYVETDAGAIWAAGSGATGGVADGASADNATFAAVLGVPGDLAGWQAYGAAGAIGLGVMSVAGRSSVSGDNGNGELGLGSIGSHALALVDQHLLNRTGPRGIQGVVGPQGPIGAAGPQGVVGAAGDLRYVARNMFPDPFFDIAAGDGAMLFGGWPAYSALYNNRQWIADYAHSMGVGAWRALAASAINTGFETRWDPGAIAGGQIALGLIVKAAAGTQISLAARFFVGAPPTWSGSQFGSQNVTATGGEDLITIGLTSVPASATGVCLFFSDGSPAGDINVLAHWCTLNETAGTRPPARRTPSADRRAVSVALGDVMPALLGAISLSSDIDGAVTAVTTATAEWETQRTTEFSGWGDVYQKPGSISFNAVRLPAVGRGVAAPVWGAVHVVVRTHATAPEGAGATVVAVGKTYLDPDASSASNALVLLRSPSSGALITVTEADLSAEFMVAYYVSTEFGSLGVCNNVHGSLSGITRASRVCYSVVSRDPLYGDWSVSGGLAASPLAVQLVNVAAPVQRVVAKPRQALIDALGLSLASDPLINPAPAEPILTPRLVGMVGLEMRQYLAESHSDLTPRLYDVACTLGKQMSDRWTLTPVATAADVAFALNVIEGEHQAVKGAGSCVINVASATAAAAASKRVLAIGDSTTNAGEYTQRLLDLAAANASAAQPLLMGTRGSGSNKHEGRPGWTLNAYYQQAAYSGLSNPFYGSGGKFHLGEYLTATSQAAPDVVVIHLGINENFGSTSDGVVNSLMDQSIDQLERIIGLTADADVGAVFEANVAAAVIIAVPIPPAASQDAFGNDYGCGQTRARYRRNIKVCGHRLIEAFAANEADNVWLLPWHMSVNPANIADSVHPASAGYAEMGDALFAMINWLVVEGHV